MVFKMEESGNTSKKKREEIPMLFKVETRHKKGECILGSLAKKGHLESS